MKWWHWLLGAVLGLTVVLGTAVIWLRPDLYPGLAHAFGRLTRLPLMGEEESNRQIDDEPNFEDKDRVVDSYGDLPAALRMAVGPATLGCSVPALPPLPEVRLSSPEIARKIGLRTARSESRRSAPSLGGNAEIAYNANLYAEVRPRVAGIIREVLVDEGSPVQPGAPMIVIDSAEVGSAKATLLAALPAAKLAEQTLDMTLRLRATSSAPLKEELSARATENKTKADVLSARQHLLNLGYNEANLEQIAKNQDTSNLHSVVAPIEGTVVERHAVPGEAVEPNHKLFGVADTRIMWAWIDVYEDQIDVVEVDQPVQLTISGTVTPVFTGRVDWIDTAVNPATRTIRIRAEMLNPTGRLRAFEFGRAAILTGYERETVIVPRDAVQNIDGTDVVFLPKGDGVYEPRPVVTRPSDEPGHMEIASGLAPGREIVVTGSFVLKSQLLKQMSARDDGS